jgi:hypothetical protein
MNKAPQKVPSQPPMKLIDFVTQLLQKGSVVLSPVLEPFEKNDLAATAGLLEQYHRWDALSMPLVAPAYDLHAAIWAAEYVCRALQFVMVRNLGEELMVKHLLPYDRTVDASAIYSADLCLRYLPDIFDLAKSLSPTDPLVENLKQTAIAWPFSVVGIPVEGNWAVENDSLQLAYADRVLACKDRKRSQHPAVNLHLQAALGVHAKRLWADFEPLETEEIDNARTIEH